jgi:hypothetical protein
VTKHASIKDVTDIWELDEDDIRQLVLTDLGLMEDVDEDTIRGKVEVDFFNRPPNGYIVRVRHFYREEE